MPVHTPGAVSMCASNAGWRGHVARVVMVEVLDADAALRAAAASAARLRASEMSSTVTASPRRAGTRSSSAMSRLTPVTSTESSGAASRSWMQRADAVGVAVEDVVMGHGGGTARARGARSGTHGGRTHASSRPEALRAERGTRVRRGGEPRAGPSAGRARGTRVRGRRAQGAVARERARPRRVRHPVAVRRRGAQSATTSCCGCCSSSARCKDASAARVTAVVPYLAYARKDQKTKARDPVTTRYVATLFEAVGADCVVTLDVHNLAAFQNAFRCRAEHLEAAAAVRADARAAGCATPTSSSCRRTPAASSARTRSARAWRAALGRPVGAAFAEKYRSGGVLSGDALVGDVDGKVAIIVDDLISAGNTIARAAHACRERGATRVIACASHGVFAERRQRGAGRRGRRRDRRDRQHPAVAAHRRARAGQGAPRRHRAAGRRRDPPAARRRSLSDSSSAQGIRSRFACTRRASRARARGSPRAIGPFRGRAHAVVVEVPDGDLRAHGGAVALVERDERRGRCVPGRFRVGGE